MKPTTEVRQLLGPLDPALRQPPGIDTAAFEHDLARILASDRMAEPLTAARPARSPRPTRRAWLATGLAAAALVVVALVGVVGLPGAHPQAAYAATPPALHYSGAADGVSARSELLSWIARTKALPAAQPARYQHLLITTWSLTTRIDNRMVTSAVVPVTTETFRAADGSGRISRHYDPPLFSSTADRERWQQAGSPGDNTALQRADYAAGGLPHLFATAAPSDPAALSAWLMAGHPSQNGPAEVFIAATDLVKEQVLEPSQRAALLAVLAAVPGLQADGAVVDRAGRAGEAFSVVSDFSGLPTRYTLLVDSASGQLLGMEQTLTERAGALNVPVPSVIEYETYRSADYRDAP
jgi:hypothetical protein